jgi:prepilin-type N-terminal cleavage/methylation domain-containing protein
LLNVNSMKNNRKQLNLESAFTLIELLVVIAIIGILSGLIVISMNGSINSANDAKRKANIDAIRKALVIYGALNGNVYPVEPGCTIGGGTTPCNNLGSKLLELLPNLPRDPVSGDYYTYASDGASYTIYAVLSNSNLYSYSSLTGVSNSAAQIFVTSGNWTVPGSCSSVEVLVVAGGGGGGNATGTNWGSGGGGGAGGLIYNSAYIVVPNEVIAITVGAGGTGAAQGSAGNGTNGGNSVFKTLTAFGGGYGASANNVAGNGGSGGGQGYGAGSRGTATSGQGNNGGNNGVVPGSGGGGGAGSLGVNGASAVAGVGGAGLQYSISGVLKYYAGGGGGGYYNFASTGGQGGVGGGGAGGAGSVSVSNPGADGTVNTGGGGGGGSGAASLGSPLAGKGGNGGSGVVIVRCK